MKSNKTLYVIIPIIFLVGILIGTLLMPKQKLEVENVSESLNATTKEISVAGVDNNGEGVIAKMVVEVKSGTGLILVNINNVLADYNAQLSARTASSVASNITNINLSNLDIIYNIKANTRVIAGPSAGAAMTIATIAALENKQIDPKVLITGGIGEDGSIASVSGIKEKASAAIKQNFNLFLIPETSYTNITYDTVKECKILNELTYCEVSFLPNKTDLSKLFGIKTIPVKHINETIPYLIK